MSEDGRPIPKHCLVGRWDIRGMSEDGTQHVQSLGYVDLGTVDIFSFFTRYNILHKQK